ncbi:MAG: hypothetical protein KatS3mg110_3973 [Pirellulaceae bacterium]|nr:MAG: hypothetical protein KatS3mg110_3973 [Pirellulaceae bacterium]
MSQATSPTEDVFRESVSELCGWRRQKVNRFEFARLAVSHRRLVRANLPQEGLCGLLDEENRTWYVIPERELDL